MDYKLIVCPAQEKELEATDKDRETGYLYTKWPRVVRYADLRPNTLVSLT